MQARWRWGITGSALAVTACLALPPAVGMRQPAAATPIRYHLERVPPRPVGDATAPASTRVRIRVDRDGPVTFALPRWVPGFYADVNWRRYLRNVRLRLDNGEQVPLEADDQRWTWAGTVPPGERGVLEYDLTPSEDDHTRGMSHHYHGARSVFLLPASTFLYVPGEEDAPCELTVDPEFGPAAAIPLPLKGSHYEAESFHQLADSPLDLGQVEIDRFAWRGVPVRVAVTGSRTCSPAALRNATRRALEAAHGVFGGVPFPDYTLQVHFGSGRGSGVGGLEHARSATLAFADRFRLTDESVRGHPVNLVFHEVFHAWNIKALRPHEFTPYRYQELPRSRALWFAEGFTQYYGMLLPQRSGLWPRAQFYRALETSWSRYANSAGRNRTSLARASEITVSNPRYGEGDGTNYYEKGLLAAALFDLRIRSATGNRHSLDDVMRWLYQRYPVGKGGYPAEFFLQAVQGATGLDLSAEYAAWIEGTDDLPLRSYLARAGLRLQGGAITEDPAAGSTALTLREGWLPPAPGDPKPETPRAAFAPLFQPLISPQSK